MVIVELTLIAVGIGAIIQNGRGSLSPDVVFAGTVVIALEGLALVGLATWLQKLLAPRARALREPA
jgi:ABC-type nitrate/sulfonate/bicarbonate transport system permease component